MAQKDYIVVGTRRQALKSVIPPFLGEEHLITRTHTAKRNIRAIAGLALGTLLSVICLVLVLRGVQWPEIVQAMRQASLLLVVAALLSYALSMWGKARRWRLLFYPQQGQMRVGKLLSVLLIGQMANVWLLARSGELARAYLIGRIEHTSKAGALGTVVVEKALESSMILLSLALLAPFMPLPGWLQTSGILLSVALVGLLLILLLAANQRERIIAWVRQMVGRVPYLDRWRLSERLFEVGRGLEGLGNVQVVIKLLGWSLAIWIISALTNYFCLIAVGIRTAWYVPLFLLVVFYIGATIPASPGRLGVFHYIAVQALALFSVDKSPALGFAIVLHLIAYVLMGLAGAICLWRENYLLQQRAEATVADARQIGEAP